MKFSYKIACFFSVLTVLSACQSVNPPVDNNQNTNTAIQITPPKRNLTVEDSIARSLKYNQNDIQKLIRPKFLGEEAHQNAFANLRKLREGQTANLSVSLKELDFAVLYTSTNFVSHPDKVDALFNQSTTQNLTLGTIKAHKNALYAHKKLFELQRKNRQYKKSLETLLKKQKQLSDSDLDYKNKLEDIIDKTNQIIQNLAQNVSDFQQLVKIDSKHISLVGADFYDKTVLPPQSSVNPYLEAAFSNRSELIDLPTFSLEEIDNKLTDQYPDNSQQVKGFYIQDTAYQQRLSARADAQASVLLQTMLNYQKAGKNKKKTLRPKLSEELHKAIYLQVETAYQWALKVSADYEAQKATIKELNQNIRKLEKVSRPTTKQKLDLLQAKLDLLLNENLADQILAEKAMSVVSLLFYSGQIYVTPEFFKKDLSEMSSALSKAFKTKVKNSSVPQKASLDKKENYDFSNTENNWAHKENWLEDLMAEKPQAPSRKLISQPRESSTDYDTKKVLQLGAFLDKTAAAEYWLKISKEFSGLQKYQPMYQKTCVAGIPLYRLFITSPQGGFKELCINLRHQNYECLLRD